MDALSWSGAPQALQTLLPPGPLLQPSTVQLPVQATAQTPVPLQASGELLCLRAQRWCRVPIVFIVSGNAASAVVRQLPVRQLSSGSTYNPFKKAVQAGIATPIAAGMGGPTCWRLWHVVFAI